jgi:kinesin family member 11
MGRSGPKEYPFPTVFGPESSNEDVYDRVAAPIVHTLLEGYNCTVLA